VTMGGLGTGLAVVCSYVLAGELARAGGEQPVAFPGTSRRSASTPRLPEARRHHRCRPWSSMAVSSLAFDDLRQVSLRLSENACLRACVNGLHDEGDGTALSQVRRSHAVLMTIYHAIPAIPYEHRTATDTATPQALHQSSRHRPLHPEPAGHHRRFVTAGSGSAPASRSPTASLAAGCSPVISSGRCQPARPTSPVTIAPPPSQRNRPAGGAPAGYRITVTGARTGTAYTASKIEATAARPRTMPTRPRARAPRHRL
jgi:hypothetical protein